MSDLAVRGWWGLLRDRSFGPFLVGKVVASIGIWMFATVAGVVTFEITGSAVAVGLVAAAQFTPQLLLAAYAGSWADRHQNLHQLTISYALACLVCLVVTAHALAVRTMDDVRMAVLVPCCVLVGAGIAIGGPMMQMVIPAIVEPAELSVAMTMDSMPMVIGRAFGPALGATVVVVAGAAPAFLLTGACFGLFALCLLLVRMPPPTLALGETSVRSGLRFIRQDPVVWRLLVGTAAIGIGCDPVLTLAPVISEELVGSPDLVGALTGAFGVGAGLGILVLDGLRRLLAIGVTNVVGLGVLAGGLLAVAACSGSEIGTIVAVAVAGVGLTVAFTSTTTLLQAHVPASYRGRVMSLWLVAFVGSRPLAAAVDGVVTEATSVAAAAVLVAGVVAAAAWLSRPRTVRRRSLCE
jgi:MFS family permease